MSQNLLSNSQNSIKTSAEINTVWYIIIVSAMMWVWYKLSLSLWPKGFILTNNSFFIKSI